MKTPIMLCAGIALVLATAVMPLGAQSLLDNQYYRAAQDQLGQSQRALDAGDYDGSASLADQARENLAKSDEYVATMTQFYRANGYLGIAKDRVAYAKSIDADTHYKAQYDSAVTAVAGARTALDGKDYPKSIALSKSAIAALANVAPVAKTPPKEPAAEPILPQYYIVQLRLPLRDCFWRIAAFPFVYNDPWKWRLLYDANKDVLENPLNPDLIEPGMKFIIPPLDNEQREGEYDPQVQYPTVGAR